MKLGRVHHGLIQYGQDFLIVGGEPDGFSLDEETQREKYHDGKLSRLDSLFTGVTDQNTLPGDGEIQIPAEQCSFERSNITCKFTRPSLTLYHYPELFILDKSQC